MSDSDDERHISRRGFLSGEFLLPQRPPEEPAEATSEEPDEEIAQSDEPAKMPPESRGPAVDLDAIVDRAETIAGVADGEDGTPHPQYQDDPNGPDTEEHEND